MSVLRERLEFSGDTEAVGLIGQAAFAWLRDHDIACDGFVLLQVDRGIQMVCEQCGQHVSTRITEGYSLNLHEALERRVDRINLELRRYEVERRIHRARNKDHRRFLKPACERCGHVPMELSELTVDHMDGNHENDNPENLLTLCATCHNWKTTVFEDFRPLAAVVSINRAKQLALWDERV